ncbi:MAG: bifunctional nuclease family protein [Planctomycetes bacterium]|jgi:bifunctional DNase/RNase|nr:bifunctional nuclease family protein [Planctomycetota bacterium]MCP4838321.1 bifunctional nuclease family protein [Planctomycetota bacterium]
MDVQMTLSRILIGEMSDAQLIELSEIDGDRRFPIVIGISEAFAIERRIKGIPLPRPLTHELLSSVIVSLGARLSRVVIHDLSEGTFYAMLCFEQRGEEIQVDARPSDAIALAVGADVPIFVSESVLEVIEQDGSLPDLDVPHEDDEDDEQHPFEGGQEWS